jgi:hypothetical protein
MPWTRDIVQARQVLAATALALAVLAAVRASWSP